MANTEKRILGDYKITTDAGSTGNVEIDTHTLTVDGNLVITGTSTTVSSTNTSVADNVIVLNSGESGAGVTSGTSGIEIDRGTSDNEHYILMKQMMFLILKLDQVLLKLEAEHQ